MAFFYGPHARCKSNLKPTRELDVLGAVQMLHLVETRKRWDTGPKSIGVALERRLTEGFGVACKIQMLRIEASHATSWDERATISITIFYLKRIL